MKIRLAFTNNISSIANGDAPFLLSAYDEYTFDEWGGQPDFYTQALEHCDDPIREVDIEVSGEFLTQLFQAPSLEVSAQEVLREQDLG